MPSVLAMALRLGAAGYRVEHGRRPLPRCILYALRDQHTPSGPKGPSKAQPGRRSLTALPGPAAGHRLLWQQGAT